MNLKAESGIMPSDESGIPRAKELMSKIDILIERLVEEKRIKNETRSQEISSNLRALGQVKLVDLTGFDTYLAWRTSQECLNTHVDKFKKAVAKMKEGPPTSALEVAAWEEVLYGLKASLAEIEDLQAEIGSLKEELTDKQSQAEIANLAPPKSPSAEDWRNIDGIGR